MGSSRRLWFLIVLYTVIIASLVWVRPKEIDWSRTYDVALETPFASKLVFEYLSATHKAGVSVLNTSWADSSDSLPQNGNLIIIGEGTAPDELEWKQVEDWVLSGGTLFWADRRFPSSIMDTFHFHHDQFVLTLSGDSSDVFDQYERLSWAEVPNADSVRFFVGYHLDACLPNDDFEGRVLSHSAHGHSVMLEISLGEGKLLFHSVPLVFTNFHFAERRNASYAMQAFSYLSDGPILWDQYRTGSKDTAVNRSPLRVIGRYPALKIAWYLSLLFILMYLFWMGKRRQAIVPKLAPKENKTLDFAEQLGDLYFKQSDARSILMRRIQALQVFSVEEFNIRLEQFSEGEKENLANKMGIAQHELDSLWKAIQYIRRNRLIEETQLVRYNQLFNKVMNQAKRYDS